MLIFKPSLKTGEEKEEEEEEEEEGGGWGVGLKLGANIELLGDV